MDERAIKEWRPVANPNQDNDWKAELMKDTLVWALGMGFGRLLMGLIR
ncbi:unnamed protein product, partial [marine sediment metagenome]